MPLSDWLFRPFEHLDMRTTLLGGLIAISLTAWLAARVGLQTDGVLTLRFSEDDASTLALLGQGLINWLVLSLSLFLAGRWLAPSRVAALDLLATQAGARTPLLLSVLYLSIPPVGERIRQLSVDLLTAMPSEPGQVMADALYLGDAFILTLFSLPLLFFLGWMVWLMFHGYRTTTRLAGPQAFFSFSVALIVTYFLTRGLTSLLS